ALAGLRPRAEACLRIVGRRESRVLNRRYRGRDRPTNVLAFPASGLEQLAPDLLGDVVLCAPVALAEAREQGKTRAAHLSHLVVHGMLHLLGFDHVEAGDAVVMEERERAVLSALGYPDPYRN
ncbi:MAG: rRNA maturation RNase YbeY, partial [Gammaproteobacteria bacterium]